MTTEQKAASDFDRASEKMGVERGGGDRYPFLPLRDKVGNWFTGTVEGMREISWIPKKGKNKGKRQTAELWTVIVEASNMPGVDAGERHALSVSGGLLGYQLENRPASCKDFPFPIGVKYSGKDEEGRHQTEVRFPKK